MNMVAPSSSTLPMKRLSTNNGVGQARLFRQQSQQKRKQCIKSSCRLSVCPMVAIPEDQSCRWDGVDTTDEDRRDVVHLLVNTERTTHKLAHLTRSTAMDRLAQEHAESMAHKKSVFHSVANIEQLKFKLSRNIVGENVQRGASVKEMHTKTMDTSVENPNRVNILGVRFTVFGAGTAVGHDGAVYLCQLFRG